MKLGFIGTGNMAGAIMGGIIKKGIIAPEEIIGSDIMEAGRERAKKEHGIHVTADNIEVTQKAEVLVLSVKPQFYAQTIAEIKDAVREDQLIITIAPGKTLAWLEEQFGKKVKIVRTMPNTPAVVGEGMTAACPNDAVTEEDLCRLSANGELIAIRYCHRHSLEDRGNGGHNRHLQRLAIGGCADGIPAKGNGLGRITGNRQCGTLQNLCRS